MSREPIPTWCFALEVVRLPKAAPDDESLGAAWVALDELARYPLRGDEVRALFAAGTRSAGGAQRSGRTRRRRWWALRIRARGAAADRLNSNFSRRRDDLA